MLHGVNHLVKFANNLLRLCSLWTLQSFGSSVHLPFWRLPVWGVPKTILRFCNLLERDTDLSISSVINCYSHMMALLQWKDTLNSAMWRDTWVRVQERSLCTASGSLLPGESQTAPTSPTVIVTKCTAFRLSQLILVSSFYWPSVSSHMKPELWIQNPPQSRCEAVCVVPNPQVNTDTLPGMLLRSLEVTARGPAARARARPLLGESKFFTTQVKMGLTFQGDLRKLLWVSDNSAEI